jgi:DNA-binding SARP family transcriptional activator
MKEFKKAVKTIGFLLLIVLQCTMLAVAGKHQAGGLLFNSVNHPYNERTSLNLTPSHPFEFSESFTLEFDISFWRSTEFGYVFRAANDQGTSFDLVYIPYQKEKSLLKLIYNGKDIGLKIELNRAQLIRNNWMTFRVDFDFQHQQLHFSRNPEQRKTADVDFPESMELNFVFGVNAFNHEKNIEVPRMALKNIRILKVGNEEASWPLNEIEGFKAKDRVHGRLATVSNPNWLLRNHYYWTKKATFYTDAMPGMAYDENRQRVLIINSDHLIDFRVHNNSYYEVYYERDCAELSDYKYSIFDSQNQRIVSYGVDLKHVCVYSEETNEWSSKCCEQQVKQNYWNHSAFVDSEGKHLYTFGGYGAFSFNNTVNSYHFENRHWSRLSLKGDKMMPRCLSAVGKTNTLNEYLIFGGYGNASGKQELGTNNFYDLYCLNLNDSTLIRKWNIEKINEDFVPVHSLVFDKDEGSFFTLCYPHKEQDSNLQLYRFSIDSAEYQIVSDPIPFELKGELKNDANLFYNRQTSEFVAVTRTEMASDSSRVDIYTMFYPVLADISVFQEGSSLLSFLPDFHLLLIGGILLSMVLVFGLRLKVFRPQTKKRISSKERVILLEEQEIPIAKEFGGNEKLGGDVEGEPFAVHSQSESVVELYPTSKKNRMRLFGSFQILAMDGTDLTEEFSPKRLHLFLLMLLYPYFYPKGVSSKKLTEILWPDHSPQSAKNNRGVNIRKLRSILEQVEGIEIVFKDNRWLVNVEEPFELDFHRFQALKEELKREYSKIKAKELLNLLDFGGFLTDLDFEWLENQMSKINDDVIDCLLALKQYEEVISDPEMALKLAEVILKFDSVNDEALELKIQMLSQLGKHGQAKAAYTEFVREYYLLYQENYQKTFPQIIEESCVA